MPIHVSAGSSGNFKPCPVGVHQAVCCDVVDMGLLEVSWNGQTKKQHKVRLVWQVDEMMDDGKPFLIQTRYTASLHEKARLRKDLESWRGKAFTESELASFDLEVLLGVNCLLNVVHNHKGDATYANVAAIMPLQKGASKIHVTNYTRVIDRDPRQAEPDEPPPVTEDDIPFVWLLPLVLPALGLLGAFSQVV